MEEFGIYKNYEGKIVRGESKYCDEVDFVKCVDVVVVIGFKLIEYYKILLCFDKGGLEKVFEMILDLSMFYEFCLCK